MKGIGVLRYLSLPCTSNANMYLCLFVFIYFAYLSKPVGYQYAVSSPIERVYILLNCVEERTQRYMVTCDISFAMYLFALKSI